MSYFCSHPCISLESEDGQRLLSDPAFLGSNLLESLDVARLNADEPLPGYNVREQHMSENALDSPTAVLHIAEFASSLRRRVPHRQRREVGLFYNNTPASPSHSDFIVCVFVNRVRELPNVHGFTSFFFDRCRVRLVRVALPLERMDG